MRKYVLKYSILESTSIYNMVGPDWIRGAPNKQQQNRKAESIISNRNNRDGFYKKLEASILEDGIRNPITIRAGAVGAEKLLSRLPEEWRKNHKLILVCDWHGGSRLWYAQKYKLDIPCLILDYCNAFPLAEILTSEKDIRSKFKDQPSTVRILENNLQIFNLPQIHMRT